MASIMVVLGVGTFAVIRPRSKALMNGVNALTGEAP